MASEELTHTEIGTIEITNCCGCGRIIKVDHSQKYKGCDKCRRCECGVLDCDRTQYCVNGSYFHECLYHIETSLSKSCFHYGCYNKRIEGLGIYYCSQHKCKLCCNESFSESGYCCQHS